ncbi:MAG: hypothetical protein KDB00_23565 [Planctomycetales bacterium]|nr:hypothetical protein [Planctomycetales bacterium]
MRIPRSYGLFVCLASISLCPINVPTTFADDATAAKSESVSVFDEGKLTIPAAFKRTEPASRIIQHEFKVGEDDATARLTMMPAGGGVEANIKRWKGQFAGGDEAEQKTEKIKVGKWEVHLVDVSGSYAERMGGGPFFGGKTVQRENYAMAGAVIVAPDSRLYFAKLIGPADVVKSNRKLFVDMIKSLGQ